jgi:integrase
MPYLHEIPWDRLPKSAPLVGKNYEPGGPKLTSTREWNRTWKKLNDLIGLPREYKFYSLRDSGLIYLAEKGIPIHHVMEQAGHSSLKTTSLYFKHANVKRVDQIGDLEPGF